MHNVGMRLRLTLADERPWLDGRAGNMTIGELRGLRFPFRPTSPRWPTCCSSMMTRR